jgi:hypothetical protein
VPDGLKPRLYARLLRKCPWKTDRCGREASPPAPRARAQRFRRSTLVVRTRLLFGNRGNRGNR